MLPYVHGKCTAHAGAVFNVCVGFIPAVVLLFNGDDPGLFMFNELHGDGTASSDDGTPAEVTANAISKYTGGAAADGTLTYQDRLGAAITSGDTTPDGFTVGTLAGVNSVAQVSYFIAFRGYAPQAS